jgi:hypothetical protein
LIVLYSRFMKILASVTLQSDHMCMIDFRQNMSVEDNGVKQNCGTQLFEIFEL